MPIPEQGTTSPWHTQSAEAVLNTLQTPVDSGLDAATLAARQQQFGANLISQGRVHPPWLLFLEQFRDFMIIILLIRPYGLFGTPEVRRV